MSEWRHYLPAALLIAGCMASGRAREPQRTAPLASLSTLPLQIAGYDGEDMPIAEEEQRIAGMSEYVMRRYLGSGDDRFTLYVGYHDHQARGTAIHSPKNCLPGAGWEPLASGVRQVTTAAGPVEVNRYLLANGSQRVLVYYWYQGRGRITADEYAVKWNLMRDAALFGRTEEALVRIVVPILAGGAGDTPTTTARGALAAADRLADTAAAELIPAVGLLLPPLRTATTVAAAD